MKYSKDDISRLPAEPSSPKPMEESLPNLIRGVLSSCNPRTAQRAIGIAQTQGTIGSRRCRRAGENTILSAFIESATSWGNPYRVSATVDEAAGELVDYACTCPASYQYDGPCKHCAALALSFADDPWSFEGYAESRREATSPALAEYLIRAERAMSLSDPASVDFEPALVHAYGQWAARFKIRGAHGSYVLKNLADFVQNMRDGSVHSYGKNLTFAHVDEAFTQRGLAIARFILRIDDARRESAKTVWYASQPGIKGRDLPLSEEELSELISILDRGDDPHIEVESTDGLSRRKARAPILRENPRLSLSLSRTENGFRLTRSGSGQAIPTPSGVLVWTDDAFYRCDSTMDACSDILRAVLDPNADSLFVASEDMPLFCATALPALEGSVPIDLDPAIETMRPVPCDIEFFFDKTGKFVTCDAFATYGQRRFRLFGPDDADQTRLPPDNPLPSGEGWSSLHEGSGAQDLPGPLRDKRAEARAKGLVEEYFSVEEHRSRSGRRVEARIPANGDDALAALLFGGLTRFRNEGTVFTTAAFDRLISDKRPTISVGISLAGNLINLDASSSDLSPDDLAGVLGSYRRRRRYHRLNSGAFLDISQMDLSDLVQIADDFDIPLSRLADGGVELPAYRAFYLDEMLHDARRSESFRRYVDGFRQPDPTPLMPPAQLRGILRPYQVEGFRWLSALADMDFGGILADEMGLGKTLQLIAFLVDRREEARATGPSLIVCPASLVYNWKAEFNRFAPDMKVVTVAGSRRERRTARAVPEVDVYVTSYDLARIDVSEWAETKLYCCTLDEAQYIKNHGTLTARAVKRLNARHRFALTGTPMENRLSEIWSIFDFVMPGFLGSYMKFKEKFELDIVGGDEEAAQRLAALVGPFMLRRLKRDVTRELPEKIESIVPVRLDAKQRKLYDAGEQKLREELAAQRAERKRNKNLPDDLRRPSVEVLAELMRLRQICCDPRLAYEDYDGEGAKLDAICDLMESAANDGQKTLVFSQFTSFLELIGEQLDARGLLYYTITGATPKRRRVALAETFNSDDTPVFLISLKAGGTGLNLTGASVVIHADPWWNAAAQNQATDRAHRIGQKRSVSVYRVIAEGTIEERIVNLQQQKSELAETILGTESISLSSLTREQLLELLS